MKPDAKEQATPEQKDWVRRRIEAVHERYTAFTALIELGIDGVPDEETPTQIPCPFHGADNRPSARYYPASGRSHDYVYCFKCRERWDSINLTVKRHHVRFMEALALLEKRFRIQIPRRPEAPPIKMPKETQGDYVSADWSDAENFLAYLEEKLVGSPGFVGLRGKLDMGTYVRFCRVLDHIAYDFEKVGKTNDIMLEGLRKLEQKMDEALTHWYAQNAPDRVDLNLSTGEVIEIAELDLSAGFSEEGVLKASEPVLSLCARASRSVMEEAKQGNDADLKPLLRDPRRAMMKLDRPVCDEIHHCPMANRQECTTRNVSLLTKNTNKLAGRFPICFSYELESANMSAKTLCDSIIQLWRRGLYVVIVD